MRYPVTITNLRGASAVVIGGGIVAERKVRGLLAGDVPVRLISPTATEQLRVWAGRGRITWLARLYQNGDLQGAALAFAATNDRAVNHAVGAAAHRLGLLVNVADAPGEGNFHSPAVTRQDGLVVSVSTLSGKPGQATAARDRIAAMLTDEA